MQGRNAWECTVAETNRLGQSGSLEQSQVLSRVVEISRLNHHHLSFTANWACYLHSLQVWAFDGVEGSFHGSKKATESVKISPSGFPRAYWIFSLNDSTDLLQDCGIQQINVVL